MAHHVGNQCIHCSVESCQYQEQGGHCSLPDIHVAPRSQTATARVDESLCSSYRSRS